MVKTIMVKTIMEETTTIIAAWIIISKKLVLHLGGHSFNQQYS
jgi:hypothetical protein